MAATLYSSERYAKKVPKGAFFVEPYKTYRHAGEGRYLRVIKRKS